MNCKAHHCTFYSEENKTNFCIDRLLNTLMVPKENDEAFGNLESTKLGVRLIKTWEIPKVLVQVLLDQVLAYNCLLEFHLE